MKLDLNVSLSFHVEPNVLFCFVFLVGSNVMYCIFLFFYYVFRGTTNILVTVFTYRYQAVKLAVLNTLTPITASANV